MAELNIQLINESISAHLSSLHVNSPDFSIKLLKEQLTKLIGQEPAIEIKRKEKPINELVKNSGAKKHEIKDKIEEISIFYVDIEHKKPIKIRMVF